MTGGRRRPPLAAAATCTEPPHPGGYWPLPGRDTLGAQHVFARVGIQNTGLDPLGVMDGLVVAVSPQI